MASESMERSMNTQNLSDIAAMRMTYLMYYVAWIYVHDSVPCLDTAVDIDRHRRRYSTHGALNLILLISRDAIHFGMLVYGSRGLLH